ncbi:DgyrCDS11707 [Dimorphilus gyrociliatus]|uniref:Poly [ADP-ribose] polymerase n=1 Tax=Dimorphilus gyrociliatus TaxID=2664684 RepID=A0A7I8W5H7_9ANNE|nr:DgyrCDS11707 [Dimorphilus gyrociliatus]
MKRKRVPTKVFEIEYTPRAASSKSKARKDILYEKFTVLAIRNEEDDFFLCKTLSDIYESTNKFPLQWFAEEDDTKSHYKRSYADKTTKDSILCSVKLKRTTVDGENKWLLTKERKRKIDHLLEKSIAGLSASEESSDDENDELMDDNEENDADMDGENEDEDKDEDGFDDKVVKKKKTPRSNKRKRESTNAKVKTPKKPKLKKTLSQKEREKKAKEDLKKAIKANPNLKLKKNNDIPLITKDLTFESRESLPIEGSPQLKSLLVTRAVILEDVPMLQKLLKDEKGITTALPPRGYYNEDNPLTYAIKKENFKIINILGKDCKKEWTNKLTRANRPKCLIPTQETGKYNSYSLGGTPFIRELSISRGSKEGNQALIKDSVTSPFAYDFTFDNHRLYSAHSYVKVAVSLGKSKDFIVKLLHSLGEKYETHFILDCVYDAVSRGHRKLAAELLQDIMKDNEGLFNFLHYQVLAFDGKENLKTFREVSAKKRPWNNHKITPIHCACINPNPVYLKKLLSVLPDINITDDRSTRPIHYAAACEGPGPIELLLNRGSSPDEENCHGMIPLMIATSLGRKEVVEALINYAETKGSEESDEDEEEDGRKKFNKFGLAGINRPIMKARKPLFSMTSVHMACHFGQRDILKILLDKGGDFNKGISASADKVTPMMIAARRGHLACVEELMSRGHFIETKDRRKKTALHHAIMCGHSTIVSLLLRNGANPNSADSSGNSCLHYAAAYGWYFIAKMLLEAGAKPDVNNDWKLTPLAVAFLKGHISLANYLIDDVGVDINIKNDKGMTLVSIASSSSLSEDLYDQMVYLVEEKKADVTILDNMKNSPLHYLAQNSIASFGRYNTKAADEALEASVKIARLLIDNGADTSGENSDKKTPLTLAIENGNRDLARLLLEKSGSISSTPNQDGQTALHLMAELCIKRKMSEFITILAQKKENQGENSPLKKMALSVNKAGETPLLLACKTYSTWNGIIEDKSSFGCGGDEDDEDGDEDSCDDDADDDEDYTDSEDAPQPKKKAKTAKKLKTTPVPHKEDKVLTSADREKQSILRDARRFINDLIKICKSDVNAQVIKISEKDNEESAFGGNRRARFTAFNRHSHNDSTTYESYCALDFLLNCRSELVDKVNNESTHFPALQMLLDHKSNVNKRHHEGRSVLYWTIHNEWEKQAIMLIDAGADVNDVSQHKQDDKRTVLSKAVETGQIEVVKELLHNGADPNISTGKLNETPLHLATKAPLDAEPKIEMTKALLNFGASVAKPNKLGQTPLHIACLANSGLVDISTEIEEILIDSGADIFAKDSKDRLPLHYAFININDSEQSETVDPIELLSLLTSSMGNKKIDVCDKNGQTPLHRAAIRGATVSCMHLIERSCDINKMDNFGNSPLGYAATFDHESCLITLLQKNADITIPFNYIGREYNCIEDKMDLEKEEKKDKKQYLIWKPLKQPDVEEDTKCTVSIFQTILQKHLSGVAYLMMDLFSKFKITYFNALVDACKASSFRFILTILHKKKEVNILDKSADNKTLLHYLAQEAVDYEEDLYIRVADAFIKKGIVVDAKDNNGCTCLHYCAINRNNKLLDHLITKYKLQRLVNQKDKFNRTLVSTIIFSSSQTNSCPVSALRNLIKHKADFNTTFSYPDIPRLYGYDENGMSSQRSRYKIFKEYPFVITPLIFGILTNNADLVTFLITEAKVDLNVSDSKGRTPLMHAVNYNNFGMVNFLFRTSYNIHQPQLTLYGPVRVNINKLTTAKSEKIELKKKHSRTFQLGRKKRKLDKIAPIVHSDEDEDEDEKEEESDIEVDPYAELGTQENFVIPWPKYSKTDIFTAYVTDTYQKLRVNVNQVDKDGNSVAHFLAKPWDNHPTYDSVQMLMTLKTAGVKFDVKNSAGQTPFDIIIRAKAESLYKAFKVLKLVKNDTREITFTECRLETYENINEKLPDIDVDADFESLKDKVIGGDIEEEDTKPKLDSVLKLPSATSYVVKDEELDRYFDVLLTKIDLKIARCGLYNFYKMQVVHNQSAELFILLTRWGRIGDVGQHQMTPFNSKEAAVAEFKSIFKSKTSNIWNSDEFEKKPGKYRLIRNQDRKVNGRKNNDINLKLKSTKDSLLSKPLQSFLLDCMDISCIKKSLQSHKVDRNLLAFGHIEKETLVKALDIINQLYPIVEKLTRLKSESTPKVDEMEEVMVKIFNLSNEYFHLVPLTGYSCEAISPLEQKNLLLKEEGRLRDLLDIELSTKVLVGAESRSETINPIDYVYKSINCKIKVLDENDRITQFLLKMTKSEGLSTKIANVFAILRPGEESVRKDVGNHYLLFHGTRTINLLGILSRGLLVAPPSSDTTGARFGKGVYLADSFQKSYQYCHNFNEKSPYNYMFVCEAAIGNHFTITNTGYAEKLPKDCDSLLALSLRAPDMAHDIRLSSGVKLRLGNQADHENVFDRQKYFTYNDNEYIIPDSDQISLRYIIQFEK